MMSDLPSIMSLSPIAESLFRTTPSEADPEGRNVIFGGQILAQTILASSAASGGTHEVKTIHAIFARAGALDAPMELDVQSIHAGRTWASDVVEARQGDRVLAESLVLLHVPDHDLIRHQNPLPEVPGPEDCRPIADYGFPGSETRLVEALDGSAAAADTPFAFWTRYPARLDSQAQHQAVLAWATNGALISVALGLHPGEVEVRQAHRSISTGVIGHSVSFCETIDARRWLLCYHEATHAGRGRLNGRGQVFSEEGALVAIFSQDSMAKAAARPLDPRQSM